VPHAVDDQYLGLDILGDLFMHLRGGRVTIKDKGAVPQERHVNHALVSYATSREGFESGKTIPAALASAVLMRKAMMDEKVIKEALKAQERLERVENHLASDNKMSNEQKQRVEVEKKQLQENLDKALEKIEELQDGMFSDAFGKSISDASKEGSDAVESLMKAVGAQAGDGTDPAFATNIVNVALDNEVKQIADLMGRLKGAIGDISEEAERNDMSPATAVDVTKRLTNIFTTERFKLSELAHPAVRARKMGEYVNHGLIGWKPIERRQKKGDIVAMIDCSSSTQGVVWETIKAITLAICLKLGDDEEREWSVIPFNGRPLDSVRSFDGADSRIALIGMEASGGTNFDLALFAGLNEVANYGRKPTPPDLLFITDGGDQISSEVSRAINKERIEKGLRLVTVQIVGYCAQSLTLSAISNLDIVVDSHKFSDEPVQIAAEIARLFCEYNEVPELTGGD
jgi:uncharacterized protein with von Willebrand factor type A (vWA) domain